MSAHTSATTVIKGAQRDQNPLVAPFNLHDLTAVADPDLERTRAEAARLLSQAQEDAISIRQQAEQQGRADGMASFEQAVAAEVARRVDSLLPAVRAAAVGIEEAQIACRTAWEQRLIRLATAIAARVIRRELQNTPEITLDLVREALQMAAGSPQLRIELNSDDYAALGPQVSVLASECSRAATVEVVKSAAVSPGGCRVETRFGTIDQQIETQLARLEEELS